MHKDLYHQPVMLQEALHSLHINPAGTYADLTFGGGGYAKAILKNLSSGRLFAFDQDQAVLPEAKLIKDKRFTFIQSNFRFLQPFMTSYHITKLDGIIADLGISSHQLDHATRGFATRLQGPLDMRMNQERSLTAAQIINTYPQRELATILGKYGEVHNSLQLAQIIVKARIESPIHTTDELIRLIAPFAPKKRNYKYYAKVFQALRIVVNDELSALQEMLMQTIHLLKPEGRLVVLSYHSLEDRLVKRFIKTGNFQGEIIRDPYGNLIRPFRPLHNKPLKASEAEIATNNRARSARLRVATFVSTT